MTRRYLDVAFDREDALLGALHALRRAGYAPEDVFTPYAVHGLDEAAGLPESRLGWVCAIAGFIAAASILLFQIWTSAIAWPLNVGGKPFSSIPAFVPVMFEFGVLLAGLSTVAAFLFRSRLWPGKKASSPSPRVTDDHFVAVYEEKDAGFDRALVERISVERGAIRVTERVVGTAGGGPFSGRED